MKFISVAICAAAVAVASASAHTVSARAVDPSLIPEFGHPSGLNPNGNGDCDGIPNSRGVPIPIPCECPPPRDEFIDALNANVAAGSVTFPEDDSLASLLARLDAAATTLLNFDGPGHGCPLASTTFAAQKQAAQGLARRAPEEEAEPEDEFEPGEPGYEDEDESVDAADADEPGELEDEAESAEEPAIQARRLKNLPIPRPKKTKPAPPKKTAAPKPAQPQKPTVPLKPKPVAPKPKAPAAPKKPTAPKSKESVAPKPKPKPKKPTAPKAAAAAAAAPAKPAAPKKAAAPAPKKSAAPAPRPVPSAVRPKVPARPAAPAKSTAPQPKAKPSRAPRPAKGGKTRKSRLAAEASFAGVKRAAKKGGVDPKLVPDFGVTRGVRLDNFGNCKGVGGKAIPCTCPPPREEFLAALNANVAAGHATKNPSVKVSFPTGKSKADQQARIGALLVTLQNIHGEGVGCPAVSTVYG